MVYLISLALAPSYTWISVFVVCVHKTLNFARMQMMNAKNVLIEATNTFLWNPGQWMGGATPRMFFIWGCEPFHSNEIKYALPILHPTREDKSSQVLIVYLNEISNPLKDSEFLESISGFENVESVIWYIWHIYQALKGFPENSILLRWHVENHWSPFPILKSADIVLNVVVENHTNSFTNINSNHALPTWTTSCFVVPDFSIPLVAHVQQCTAILRSRGDTNDDWNVRVIDIVSMRQQKWLAIFWRAL